MLLPTTLVCSTVLSMLGQSALAVAQDPAPAAPANAGDLQFRVGDTEFQRLRVGGVEQVRMRRVGTGAWIALEAPDDRLRFVNATFDPLTAGPGFAGVLAAPAGTRLLVVQFHTQVMPQYRDAIAAAGAEVLHVLPTNAVVVRADRADALRELPCVRWVGPLANGFKLDAALAKFVATDGAAAEINLALASKADRARLAAQVAAAGGKVTSLADGSTMLAARLTPKQLLTVLDQDTVVYADLTGEVGYDMDNARIQGGTDYVETATMGAYRGQGVRAEITEAFEETHPDFAGRFVVRTTGVGSHGHCTAGIVAGAGAGNAAARGVMTECTVIEGGYTSNTMHYAMIQGSADPSGSWRSMQATASWGGTLTGAYTTVSQAVDDALFDFDFVRTQSMSNWGNNTQVRPEAWPKNTISVGAIKHKDTATPADDDWTNGASIGPAADGRLKPEICAYYDSVLTSDRTGTAGYASGNYYASFSGTSSATPIVNGHVGIIQQMFTDGLFGNPLPLPATAANRFANKAHAATTKALLCNTATQYAFTGTGADLSRVKQGWGFPSLQRLYDNRGKIVVLDEYDTLQVGQSRTYFVHVAAGTPELRATMAFSDPAALPSAAVTAINNLNLKVTRFSDGTFWWGNNGLAAGNFSTSGGVANTVDTLECVYLQNPLPGLYLVEVSAPLIAQDAKVETPQIDADFALVIHPVGGGYRTTGGLTLDLQSTGPGNLTFAASGVPASGWTDGFTLLSFNTTRGQGFGRFFGIEDDSLTLAVWSTPASAGNGFHFTNTGGVYPFANFVFPAPGLISFFAGFQIDGAILLWNGGNIAAVSNVDRLTLQ